MILSRRIVLAQIAAGSGIVAASGFAKSAAFVVTPRETEGPFYPVSTAGDADADLTMIRGGARAKGQVIEISGRLLDSKGRPVAGGAMDIWQANAVGRYTHPADTGSAPLDSAFDGFGRLRTDREGGYRFVTIKPGSYAIPGDVRTPHIHLRIAAAGERLSTQMYFPGEELNKVDLLMREMADPTPLIARENGRTADGIARLAWDIVLPSG